MCSLHVCMRIMFWTFWKLYFDTLEDKFSLLRNGLASVHAYSQRGNKEGSSGCGKANPLPSAVPTVALIGAHTAASVEWAFYNSATLCSQETVPPKSCCQWNPLKELDWPLPLWPHHNYVVFFFFPFSFWKCNETKMMCCRKKRKEKKSHCFLPSLVKYLPHLSFYKISTWYKVHNLTTGLLALWRAAIHSSHFLDSQIMTQVILHIIDEWAAPTTTNSNDSSP